MARSYPRGITRISLQLAVAPDQTCWSSCRARALARLALSSFGNDPLGKRLAQFDAPLVEGIDLPDRALGEDAVLVERHQLAQALPGVSASSRKVLDGRLPSNSRCGTSQSGVPSAFTCSAVLPKASASAWAKTLASSIS